MSNAEDTSSKVSSLAGQLTAPAMLAGMPRFVTAYYSELPDASVPRGCHWNLALDASRVTPPDVAAAGAVTSLDHLRAYRLQAHSSAILLVSKQESTSGQPRV